MDRVKNIVKKVRETISRYKMTDHGDIVIVAVSGGPDSVSLLDILNNLSDELGLKLVVAHYNHGLREAEDESETRLVQGIAESMGLTFETEKASLLRDGDASMEEKARVARYAFLERVSERFNAQKVAMGHNLNDQAETVLMRILRGSGPSGMAGIPPVRDKEIIRPLIEIKREEIMDYLTARGLSYAVDSSNIDTRYLRNRIRLELLPLMLDYQPQLIEHLGRLSVILREEDDFMELQAADWVEREAEQDCDGPILIPVSSFKELHGPLRNRVARHLLKKVGKNLRRIENDHIQSVSGLADNPKPQAMIDLPNGIILKKVYDRLIFSSGPEHGTQEFSFAIKGPGSSFMEHLGRTITLEEIDSERAPDSVGGSDSTVCLDADRIRYPLIVRNFRPGDRFVPLGMKGHKKVKDFFIDLKIPSYIRASTPILTCLDTPVWICGYRIDDRFKVTPGTKKILKITIS
ncbi:tRNA lysidine(34) synthetase TilS [Thermodesulfobacteriota bacterium]